MKKYLLAGLAATLMFACNQNQNPNQYSNQDQMTNENEPQEEIHWHGPVEEMFWRGPGYYNGQHIESESEFRQWRDSHHRARPHE